MTIRLSIIAAILLTLAFAFLVFAQGPAGNIVEQAVALKRQGNTEKALGKAKQAVQSNDKDARAHYVLAWVLIKRGDRKQAAQHFEKAMGLGLSGEDAELAKGALMRLGGKAPAARAPAPTPPSPFVDKPAKGGPGAPPGGPPGAPPPKADAKSAPSTSPGTPPGGPSPSAAPHRPAAPPGAPPGMGASDKPVAEEPEKEAKGIVGGLSRYAPIAAVFIFLVVVLAVVKFLKKTRGGAAARAGGASLPETISLTSVSFEDLEDDTAEVALLSAELQQCGFERIDDYQIPEMDMTPCLRAMVNPAVNTFAIVYLVPGGGKVLKPWVDLVTPFGDGSSLTTTTSKKAGLVDKPPNLRVQAFPKASAEGLLEKHRKKVAELCESEGLAVLAVGAGVFHDHFMAVYHAERDFRQGQGGATKDGVWRGAEATMPDSGFLSEEIVAATEVLQPTPGTGADTQDEASEFDFSDVDFGEPVGEPFVSDPAENPDAATDDSDVEVVPSAEAAAPDDSREAVDSPFGIDFSPVEEFGAEDAAETTDTAVAEPAAELETTPFDFSLDSADTDVESEAAETGWITPVEEVEESPAPDEPVLDIASPDLADAQEPATHEKQPAGEFDAVDAPEAMFKLDDDIFGDAAADTGANTPAEGAEPDETPAESPSASDGLKISFDDFDLTLPVEEDTADSQG